MSFDLSEEASAALLRSGPVLVLGGPGSGKTTLSLLKAQQLIPTLEPGQEILFLSFSRAAVRQVLLRCADVLTSAEYRLITVKTYHAFCMDLLRAHGRLLNGRQARILFPAEGRLRKTALGSEAWDAEEVRLAADDGVYAFDQFAPSAARLVGGSLALAELISDRYPIVILDEFQDTSDAEWELVQHLAKRSRLIVLADPDQRIFEWDKRVDVRRLEQLREVVSPGEFDLGGLNHRSPNAGILAYADAVLRNGVLPDTRDVVNSSYRGGAFALAVHVSVAWAFAEMRKLEVENPSVAVLARTNALVGQISSALDTPHTYKGTTYSPIEHELNWDAEQTTAAALVVASILEWPQKVEGEGVAATLEAIADYYDVKNANRPSAASTSARDKYRGYAQRIREGQASRRPTRALVGLLEAGSKGIDLVGDPTTDWLTARDLITGIADLAEIATNVRYVRLLRATGEIGGRLGDQWSQTGTYGNAAEIVRRALEASLVMGDQRAPRGCILMSLHKSKGKEFDAVVLVEGQYTGQFFNPAKEPAPFMASRRLLRVGITRARRRVTIVRPSGAPALADGTGTGPH
ncbi:ATP-dependent helicase [Actinotalea sp. AC32]|nr:ATP-dependent helicase [Actinotalea sp. AC32]